MKSTRILLATAAAAGLAASVVAAPAGADATVTPDQLATAVVHKGEVAPWYKKAKTLRAPAPGKGDSRIPLASLCFTHEDDVASVRVAKRQAWSDTRLGKSAARTLQSIIGQYNSKAKAKTKMQNIRTKIANCPAIIVGADGTTITSVAEDIGTVYGTKGIGLYVTIETAAEGDTIEYTAIRRTGRAIAFTNLERLHDWAGGPPATVPPKVSSMVDFLSVRVAETYRMYT